MPNFKRITDYTDDELKLAINDAISECQKAKLDFWNILKGVDSYMEQRTRKRLEEARAAVPQEGPRNVKSTNN